MNKTVKVVVGVVVVAAVVTTAGAWYVGTKIEDQLQASIKQANTQIQTAMNNSGSAPVIELLSIERHLFSSTAHYRVRSKDDASDNKDQQLLFVDHLQHGPFPLSRLSSFKLVPVMVSSHLELEKNALTAKVFAANSDVSPFQAYTDIAFDRSGSGSWSLLPLDMAIDDTTHLKFSGLTINGSASANAKQLRFDGKMDALDLTMQSAGDKPAKLNLQGWTFNSDQHIAVSDVYVGNKSLKLASVSYQVGEEPAFAVKDIVENDSSDADGNNVSGRMTLGTGPISIGGKEVGSSTLAASVKNVDVPSMQALTKFAERKGEQIQAERAADSDKEPSTDLTPAEKAELQTNLKVFLGAKPQWNLENISLKTTQGESHFNLKLDLQAPSNFDLPLPELIKQSIAQLDTNAVIAKGTASDIATLQAQLSGETVVKAAAAQGTGAAEMLSALATGSGMATLQGDNIVTALKYADDKVTFNGKTMSVQEFAQLMMGLVGGMGGGQ